MSRNSGRARQKAQPFGRKHVEYLNEVLLNNGRAQEEGPQRKTWTLHDMKTIRPMTPPQEDMFHSYYNDYDVCAYGSAGTGKAQPLDSKVLTMEGWKLMGDIKVGEVVLTPSGGVANVVGVFPQGKKDIYRITFSDGSTTRCCGEHLWECYVPISSNCRRGSVKKVISTFEMIDWLEKKKQNPRKIQNVGIDTIAPIQYGEKAFEIDPYLLGVFIGDGCLRTATPQIANPDLDIMTRVNGLVRNDHVVKKLAKSDIEYSIIQKYPTYNGKGTSQNFYTGEFIKNGLHGTKSYEKFIPEEYKQGSIGQRLALIQGLFDTDGTVDRATKGVNYCTTSLRLAKDVQDILWSLGAKCSIQEKPCKYVNANGERITTGQTGYTLRVSYRTPKDLFHLPRKKELCADVYEEKQLRRYVREITLDSNEEAQCIMLDDPKHLYITDDYIITHNTFIALYLAFLDILDERTPRKKIIIVRSIVSTRDPGHLPGTLEEKAAPHEATYPPMFKALFGKASTYKDMKAAGLVEFVTTSFVRGQTWESAIVIFDEATNTTIHEFDSVMTRMGKESKVFVLGDIQQNDLSQGRETSGFAKCLQVMETMGNFSMVRFVSHDIVRSGFVKAWIQAREALGI